MIRIVLADDHALIRGGLAGMLGAEDDITVVGEAADGAEAVDLALRERPDVVVMDIRMPRMDGIAATRRLAENGMAARVLVLTTFDLDEYVYEALRAGAGGFLLKDASPARLAEAVRTVAAGDALFAPTVTRRLVERFVRHAPAGGGTPGAFAGLTARELEVARMIARGSTNAEIAGSLHLSEATVKTHVGRVMAKVGARDRVGVVVAAYEAGLVERGTPDA
ncbi:MAG: response regulator [Thermoleophilia bacterium]